MSHAAYVAIAYGLSALALAALIAWTVADLRGRRRELAELERRGVSRRSKGAAP